MFLMIFYVSSAQEIKKESRLALMHYLDKNYKESFNDYTQLIKYKDPEFYSILALHYHYGLGTIENLDKAIEYYKLAANKGDKTSQAELCQFYYNNEKIEHTEWQNNLYKYSRMFSTNFEWDSSSGRTEDLARYALYLCYKNGWGTKANPVLADMWLAFSAFNDSMFAQDEFCEKYNISGAYNSHEEEIALAYTYFRHGYNTIAEYMQDDFSIEAEYLRLFYQLITPGTTEPSSLLRKIIELYERDDVPVEGKALLYDVISSLFDHDKELKDKYGSDEEKYELVSGKEKNQWDYSQITKLLWKIDAKLNRKSRLTGNANGHDWVDLALPSQTKWATCNIGSNQPTQHGHPFAWAELDTKKKFSKSNYKGNETALTLDESFDVSTLYYGYLWKTPSIEDWQELFFYCDIIYDNMSRCIIAQSPNGQSVLLPLELNTQENGYLYWTDTKITQMSAPKDDTATALIINRLPDWGFVYSALWEGNQIRPILK